MGERAVGAATSKSFIVRTSWVYGAGKDSFLGTVHRHLLAGERVRAITDVWANTTYVADLVARTEEIIERRHYGRARRGSRYIEKLYRADIVGVRCRQR